MVEISHALAEKLDPLGPHFCLVAPKDKNPNVGGKGWQKPEKLMCSTDPKLTDWLAKGGNYGVVGGFGLVILDVDIKEIKQLILNKLPRSFTVKSPGSQGWHCYYLCGLEKPIRLRDEEGENVGDIQGPGKMVVGPCSVHPNGGVYEIIADVPLAQVTKHQLVEALKSYVVPEKEIIQVEQTARNEKARAKVDLDVAQVVPLARLHKRGDEYFGAHPIHGSKTGRNFWVNAAKNCWHCFRHGSGGGPLLWLAVEEGLVNCAEAGSNALRGEVFKQVLQKARERGLIKEVSEIERLKREDTGRQSQADMLVKLARNNAEQVFHDERKVPYIRLHSSKALRTLRLRSRDVKSWLAGLLWKTYEKAPNQEALGSALNVLEAQCQEGSACKLHNRIAPGEDSSIWIDMADEKCRAIHVTREGWQIVDNPPILFRRYSHQKAIPEPVRGGNVNQILEFANIKNEADKLLSVVTTVTYFIPDIPHAILIFFGPQGSGKTWSLGVIRRLVDPSQLDLLNLPRRPRELVQNLDHHWCSFYDNVGRVPEWCSNVFCRAVTGMGVSKRALYTDDDDVIYSYHRCIGLTDINIAAERGDMLQRSLLLGLQAIPKKQRKTEKELKEIFEHVHPSILGAILDVLVKAIQIYPTIKLQGLHRMADYVVWSCAITEALGIDKQQFLDAYEQNIIQQNLEMVRASPISDTLIKLMEEHPKGWEGTASQLFAELDEKAKELKISTRQKTWPKKPHILSRRLNELAPSLPAVGYEINRGHKGKTRLILITTVGSVGSGENSVGTDATAGTFGSFSVHVTLEDLKVVHWADEFYGEHECCICGYLKKTSWQAEDFKGNKLWICDDCKLEWEKERNRVD